MPGEGRREGERLWPLPRDGEMGRSPGAGRIRVPKGVHILIPGTCDHVILHGRRDLADVIKLGVLSWGDYPGLSGSVGPVQSQGSLEDGRGRQESQNQRDGSTRKTQPSIAGGRGHEPKNVSSF